ncbi:6-carboxytetrahydropterin synthase [Trinickia sp. LjRoot230]|uniref:6-pyruvoyl trahydropterin synthase family protein n=1 Tax=Trinickia sp. LjRoot230 TaxID=3342288 RepID=UPI003ECD2FA0
MRYAAQRYHDISCGHRVAGHESKCRHLHGHNYRVHFTCEAELDDIGRVIDFSVIKSKLCMWLEDNWDHRFILWEQDPMADRLCALDDSVVLVPFNPTAENMAGHLVHHIGPQQLEGTSVVLVRCTVEETRKCAASCDL